MARSLAWQSVLVAAVCLVTDVVSFATRGPESLGVLDALLLTGLVVADVALATSPRHSAWVALAHAALLPLLAVVVPGRSASTAGQPVSTYRAGAWLERGPAGVSLADRNSSTTGPVTTSLTAVEASSRAAMVDLRRLLDVLHEGDASLGGPGLDKLQELFEGVRSAGLRVSFVVYNDPRAVARSVDTALYRVAQEMMTNALRHGDGTAVRVELEYGGDHVTMTARSRAVSDAVLAGRNSLVAQRGSARGLTGIGQRAEKLGGTATSGLVEGGQFWETSVTLPAGEPGNLGVQDTAGGGE